MSLDWRAYAARPISFGRNLEEPHIALKERFRKERLRRHADGAALKPLMALVAYERTREDLLCTQFLQPGFQHAALALKRSKWLRRVSSALLGVMRQLRSKRLA